jgi:hypothetical protein
MHQTDEHKWAIFEKKRAVAAKSTVRGSISEVRMGDRDEYDDDDFEPAGISCSAQPRTL